MASSPAAICNRALGAIGVSQLATLEDGTARAIQCNALYPQLRDELLRDHDWNFASTRASLPALSVPPVWGFDNLYQLPGDCLSVREIENIEPRQDWRVEAGAIAISISAPLHVRYTAKVIGTGAFDASFTSALVAALAAELCMPLTNNASLFAKLDDKAARQLAQARGRSRLEGADRGPRPWRILDIRA